ncbi:MAG: hypothetical protein WBM58_08830, partial [Sedimenticolaceae bacterium]
FTLGTRLHGVIASLLAGTPAVLISHDSRTEEMAAFAGIPSVRGRDLLESQSINIQSIIESADFEQFNTRQQQYFANFRDFFEANNVGHNLSVKATVSAPASQVRHQHRPQLPLIESGRSDLVKTVLKEA